MVLTIVELLESGWGNLDFANCEPGFRTAKARGESFSVIMYSSRMNQRLIKVVTSRVGREGESRCNNSPSSHLPAAQRLGGQGSACLMSKA
jgi:hypothetical protein